MWKNGEKREKKVHIPVENFCREKWKKMENQDKKFSTDEKRIFNRKNVEKEISDGIDV